MTNGNPTGNSAAANKRRGLGRGLGALIVDTQTTPPPAFEETNAELATESASETASRDNGMERALNEGVRQLALDQISPNPQQPRTYFDPEALEELAASIRAHGRLTLARFASPNVTRAGSISTPSTLPVGPVRCARRAVVHPEPLPTSSTRSPVLTSSSQSMSATVRGWELVCPCPMGIGPSKRARRRDRPGRNPARGVASNAAWTASILEVFRDFLPGSQRQER